MKSDRLNIHETILFIGLMIAVLAIPFSIQLCHFGILIIVLNWIVQGNWKEKWNLIQQTPQVVFFALYFSWIVFGTFYSEDFANAWLNVEKKFTFAVLPIVLATSTVSDKNKTFLYQAFVFCCGVGAVICLGSAVYRIYINSDLTFLNFGITQPGLLLSNPLFTNNWQQLSYVALASGIGIHPTYFSVYLIFCICIVVSQYYARILNGYVSLALILFFTLFLALLSSRIILMVILTFALFGLAKAIVNISPISFKKVAIVGTFISLFLILSALNPISLYRDFQEIKSTNFRIRENSMYTNSTEIRLSLWWAGLKTSLRTNSIIGSGSGDTNLEMGETLANHNISNSLNTSDPHHQFINTFIANGLIGLILLLCCYLYPVKQAWLQGNTLQLSFIGLVVLASLTESFLESQKGIVFFVLFQSLALRPAQFSAVDYKIASI